MADMLKNLIILSRDVKKINEFYTNNKADKGFISSFSVRFDGKEAEKFFRSSYFEKLVFDDLVIRYQGGEIECLCVDVPIGVNFDEDTDIIERVKSSIYYYITKYKDKVLRESGVLKKYERVRMRVNAMNNKIMIGFDGKDGYCLSVSFYKVLKGADIHEILKSRICKGVVDNGLVFYDYDKGVLYAYECCVLLNEFWCLENR